ncbi:MAG: c-type cytochrome [Proteobacteria bacterium]|jgi:cytochrome c|nr:c-type cytochrome [Pseudomonadota bacterium]
MFSTTKLRIVFFMFFFCSVFSVAHADQALANAKGCMACHQIDAEKVGPPFRMVAKKYQGQKDALAKLPSKVLDGGSGVWGEVAMPANKTLGVTKADATKLVAWVLSLK